MSHGGSDRDGSAGPMINFSELDAQNSEAKLLQHTTYGFHAARKIFGSEVATIRKLTTVCNARDCL